MGVLKKLANINKYERGANYELGHSLNGNAVSTIFGKGGTDINVLEEYNGFVWKCINIQAATLSDQDLFVERLVGKKWQEDPNHQFNLILEGGDGSLDQSELLEAHKKSMMLYGESFWYWSMAEGSNKPYAVYLLDPSCVTVLVADNRVSGYVYQKNGDKVVLDLNEVDHFKIIDPRNSWRGYGPMQAAGWFIRSARYVNTYVNNFLENNAIPAGVIVAKGAVDDDDWKLFKEQWSEKYGGIDNSGKTGYIRGQDLDFVKTGMSLGEVDFEKIKNTSRDDIMVMFGISKPMMAIYDDINRASAITARQLFAITNTAPDLRQLRRKLSKKVAKWYGPQYRVGSTNPIPEDEDAELNKFDKLLGRAFTRNEVRVAYGLEPVAGGDEFDSATVENAKPAPKSIGKVTIRTKNTKAEFNYEMKESFRSKMEDLQVKYEQSFYQATNPLLKDQKERVLDQLMPKKVVDANFVPEDEAVKLSVEITPLLIELAKEQGDLAAKFAGNADSTFELTEVMKKYIADSVAKAALSFNQETQEAIAKALAEGLQEGESIAKIGKRIESIYKDVLGIKTPGYRIERLARTEVIKTSNEITEAAYRQSGVVNKKEWFANPGCCEYCKALNGSIVQLGTTFVPKDATITGVDGGTRVNTYEDVRHPPVHPACRCALIPVIEALR